MQQIRFILHLSRHTLNTVCMKYLYIPSNECRRRPKTKEANDNTKKLQPLTKPFMWKLYGTGPQHRALLFFLQSPSAI